MPSLLHKNSFFDVSSGRQFIATDDGFYWKEAKKSPEDAKATALLQQYGWNLMAGNDVWLVFKRRGTPGELTVMRSTKEWYWDKASDPDFDAAAEGVGLKNLKEALDSGVVGGKAMAMAMHASPASTAVNNAGTRTMHDDSGAQTGLRNRPDYGESDSYTVEMNEANSKGASILVLDGGVKTGSATTKAKLFVTGATFNGMVLERFTFSPDPRKARTFAKLTAQNLSRQLKGKFGVTANVLPAKAV